MESRNLAAFVAAATFATTLALGQPSPTPQAAQGAATAPTAAPAATPTPVPQLLAGLAALRAGKLAPGDVHIDVFWYAPEGPRSLEVFGPTVGVWERDHQFTTSKKTLDAALALFDTAGFTTMPDHFGNKAKPAPPKQDPKPMQRLSRVTLAVGPFAKTVIQIDRGEQSAELATLVTGLFSLYGKEKSTGAVGAADLKEALARLHKAELSAGILKLNISCPQQKVRSGVPAPGWLLRIGSSWAEAQSHNLDKGYGPLVVKKLSAKRLAEIVAALDETSLATLPINIVAAGYTDLSVTVLRHERSIQAREFSGNVASRKPEDQAAFATLVKLLQETYLEITGAR
jgi:hypothetical protein